MVSLARARRPRIPAHHHRAGQGRLVSEHQTRPANHESRGAAAAAETPPRPAPGLSDNSITKPPPQYVNDVWTDDFRCLDL